ncbi:cupin domain-containing protein, partial [Gemmiger formicilis]|uniref:cupin domain-containing protein n=1 Tax=Gemmiger formicilis TaxID=745368 RepID=UPI00195B98A9
TVDVHQNDFAGTAGAESFVSLLIVDGEGTVTCGGETMPVKKGDSVFIPANSGGFAVTGTLQTLCTRV